MKSKLLVLICCFVLFSACTPDSAKPTPKIATSSISQPGALTITPKAPAVTLAATAALTQTATHSEDHQSKEGVILQAISSEGSINVRSGPGIYLSRGGAGEK